MLCFTIVPSSSSIFLKNRKIKQNNGEEKIDLQTLFCTPVSCFYVDVFAIFNLLLSRYPVTQQRFAQATSGICTIISGKVLELKQKIGMTKGFNMNYFYANAI